MAGVGPFQAFGSTSIPGMTGSFVGGPAAGTMGPIPSFGQQVAQVPQNISGRIKNLIGEKDVTNKVTGAVTKEGSWILRYVTRSTIRYWFRSINFISR
jgi:hypothetical protein